MPPLCYAVSVTSSCPCHGKGFFFVFVHPPLSFFFFVFSNIVGNALRSSFIRIPLATCEHCKVKEKENQGYGLHRALCESARCMNSGGAARCACAPTLVEPVTPAGAFCNLNGGVVVPAAGCCCCCWRACPSRAARLSHGGTAGFLSLFFALHFSLSLSGVTSCGALGCRCLLSSLLTVDALPRLNPVNDA